MIDGMPRLHEVPIASQSIDRLIPLVGEEPVALLKAKAEAAKSQLRGREFWNVNSTAHGGGVAEMLHSLMPYVRGLGIDTRWAVIEGNQEFFKLTKRLHHALHGSRGDCSDLGDAQRAVYEAVAKENAAMLSEVVEPGDVVVLHDPQTAGLAPHLMAHGAIVMWRCHVGSDEPGTDVELAWDFLAPYLEKVPVTIFTREQYIPDCCDHGRSVIVAPSIDPFSPKNQEMSDETARSILVNTGLIEAPNGAPPVFTRQDGSPGRVDRQADIVRSGRAPAWDVPLIVQVSRWDPLKDPVGVMQGFVRLLERPFNTNAELVLAGPNVTAVSDDPEGKGTLDGVEAAWRELPHGYRDRVHLACLPMTDGEENAAIVNALQRHAAVIVQKSLKEGFGLTVTEAMWKAKPVVGSAVGGIRDQIEDGVSGLLLGNPRDADEFATALERLLKDEGLRTKLGNNAREKVRENFLATRHLLQYGELLERLAGD
ncbi:MAG: glycosyl transferase family 1 [Chloroflexi bacterium]|nr:MAG: glycosyl transferase family 1 [Chloroflexota bacterium]